MTEPGAGDAHVTTAPGGAATVEQAEEGQGVFAGRAEGVADLGHRDTFRLLGQEPGHHGIGGIDR